MRDNPPPTPVFPAADHDHAQCVRTALDAVERVCEARGVRLTALRRRVLELVWQGHRPVGAYDVLDALSRERGRVAPPTVYRALDFLLHHGFIHRIERLNAYIGCPQPGTNHVGHFLICRQCGSAAEVADARTDRAIAREAAAVGFSVERETVEISGTCPGCRPHDAAAREPAPTEPADGRHG